MIHKKKSKRQLEAEIAAVVLGPVGNFRVEFADRGRRTMSENAGDYVEALRMAKNGLLGSSGDEARVFLGDDLVNVGNLRSARVGTRGIKNFVSFDPSGEKPRKIRKFIDSPMVRSRRKLTYSVDDSSGRRIASSLSINDAKLTARRLANDLGESVWLYRDSEGAQAFEAREVTPVGRPRRVK